MNATFGRTCLILGLLCPLLAAAVSIDLKAWHGGVTVQAGIASTMTLQGSPDGDEASVAPDLGQNEKRGSCTERGCPTSTPELAFALTDDHPPHESKAIAATAVEIRLKSKD